MGLTIAKTIGQSVMGSKDTIKAEQAEADFRARYEAAVGKAEKQASQIEQRLRIAGSKDDNGLTVPISNVFSRTVVARFLQAVDTVWVRALDGRLADRSGQTQPAATNSVNPTTVDEAADADGKLTLKQLNETIEDSIVAATGPHITTGVADLLSGALKSFFGSFHGTTASEERYFLVMVGRSLERIDTYFYTEKIQSGNLSFQCNIAVVYRSPVDISQLKLSSFISAYQYQVASTVSYGAFLAQCSLYLEMHRNLAKMEEPGFAEKIDLITQAAEKIQKFEDAHQVRTLHQRCKGMKKDAEGHIIVHPNANTNVDLEQAQIALQQAKEKEQSTPVVEPDAKKTAAK